MSLVHQNWWVTTLPIRSHKYCPPLSKSLKCDVLIVGGGVTNRRHFTLPAGLVRLISKPILFSLTNAWAKFYQVDSHRKTAEMKGEF